MDKITDWSIIIYIVVIPDGPNVYESAEWFENGQIILLWSRGYLVVFIDFTIVFFFFLIVSEMITTPPPSQIHFGYDAAST